MLLGNYTAHSKLKELSDTLKEGNVTGMWPCFIQSRVWITMLSFWIYDASRADAFYAFYWASSLNR
jgi:hypothetical protein